LLAPWMAALGMSLSSLLVMLNALRLGTALPESPQQPAASACCAGSSDPEPVI